MSDHLTIGFSTNIWDNPADIVGHLRFLARHFTEIEFEIAEEAQDVLFSVTSSEYDAIVEGVRAVRNERGLSMSVHAAWFGRYTDLCSPDENERQGSIGLLQRAVQFAGDIGVDRVTYHPGFMSGRSNAVLLDVLRDSLDQVLPAAQAADVSLSVENMGANRPRYIVLSPEEHVELCISTGTMITLDVPHLATVHLPRGNFMEALATVAPYVQTAHIADIVGSAHTHLPIGMGDFDLWGALEALERLGFTGPAIIEEFAEGYTPEMYLERGLAFQRAWLARDLAQTS